MGPNAVANPAALVAALKSQQPPQNPKTPLERLNPDQQALEHIKAASVSLERAQQFTNDTHMLLAFNAIGGVLTKALLRFDGAAVVQALQEAVQSFPPMVAPAPGGGPMGPQGAPTQSQGGGTMPPGAPPAAPPGQQQGGLAAALGQGALTA
jgi:hypothetical protein